MIKARHLKEAKSLLNKAEELLADYDYVRLHGYNEINVLLTMADLHERLSR